MGDGGTTIILPGGGAIGDGTYNGAKALSWLSEVLSPGRGMSEDTIHAMFTDAKRKAARQLA